MKFKSFANPIVILEKKNSRDKTLIGALQCL